MGPNRCSRALATLGISFCSPNAPQKTDKADICRCLFQIQISWEDHRQVQDLLHFGLIKFAVSWHEFWTWPVGLQNIQKWILKNTIYFSISFGAHMKWLLPWFNRLRWLCHRLDSVEKYHEATTAATNNRLLLVPRLVLLFHREGRGVVGINEALVNAKER